VAARAALASALDPLLDNSAAEIRVDQAAVGALDRLLQTGVVDALTPGVPNQPFGFEDAHAIFLRHNYST
jgi:hypothetical protein